MTSAPFSLGRTLGDFPALAAALRGIEKAALTEVPILILGEAGTGRTALARAIHEASPRAAGPLVEIDPGSFPSALFESELFGHRAGAFTGAAAAAPGRVARAADGTLVLDRLEELPLSSQPKLLRLLAERCYAPLGGDEVSADVRFIAIGPHDLDRRIARGAFRADLFYRLEVVSFRLPPLRERQADLPMLLDVLLADLGERFGFSDLRLTPAARDWMTLHPWPGNLRQLRNVLERAAILDEAVPAAAAGLAGLAGAGRALNPPAAAAAASAGPVGDAAPPRRLVVVEEEQIRAALAWTRGHQGRAAALLGISRKALWEKRRRLGIP